MQGVTHELFIVVREVPEHLTDDPDFMPQPRLKAVAPGTSLQFVPQGDSASLHGEGPSWPDPVYRIRSKVVERGETYIALEIVDRWWTKDRAGLCCVARMAASDRVIALTPAQLEPVRGRFGPGRSGFAPS